jgi:hypothetical protein
MNIIQDFTVNCWPGRNKPDEIVIHHWDDPAKHPTLAGVRAHFHNTDAEVSAHYVVSDQTVVQMVKEADAAWHAVTANTHSIGIEIDPNFPGKTYETVGALVADIRSRYGNLPLIRHRDVPGTSTSCPGNTDLGLIDKYARGEADMKADLGMVKQMAQTIGGRVGRNGFPDTNGTDLNGHVGTEAGQEFLNWYWSKEGVQWRDKILPDILNVWDKYKTLGPQLEKQVADLKAQQTSDSKLLDELSSRLIGKK